MFYQTPLRNFMMIAYVLICIYVANTAEYFGIEILTELLILAMVAIALDMVAGFGGMVSLCHGALAGVGAYVFAALTTKLGWGAAEAAVIACLVTASVSWVIGAVCSKSHGIYFIMATLAFGQMGYSFVFESSYLGGDNGLSSIPRFDLTAISVDLFDSKSFALFCLFCLVISYLFIARVLSSGLGRSILGVMYSEKRSRALGQPVTLIKANIFGLSGLVLGLAGSLAAQHFMFISPSLLSWTHSGEVLVVVILGGIGTLFGPIVGASAFVMLKHEISNYTDHWHLIVGAILILVVMGGAKGIYGMLESYVEQRRERAATPRKVLSEE